MSKKLYVITAPENGWDNVVEVVMADNEEKVWEYLAEQNIGDTVKKLKKERFYHVKERRLVEL